ncbi:MAG: hypothetical protein H0W21_07585 [Actinobacteria bacterium]|nr:hypothetical protein [Actinomycetota bacterium]
MSFRATAILVLCAGITFGGCGPRTAVPEASLGDSRGAGSRPVASPGSPSEQSPLPEPVASPSAAERVTPEPSPGPLGASKCSNEVATVSDPAHRSPGALRGDVDGDGRSEVAWLAIDRRAEVGCQVFLAVTSGSVAQSLPIVQPELNLALNPPALNALAAIDTEPGLEIVVDLVIGASTRFVGLFGMQSGALTRVRFDGSRTLPPDLFAYGGTVAHLDGVDCRRPQGTIVISSASPTAQRYAILRRFYQVKQGSSIALPLRTEHRTVEPRALNRFSELTSTPFASCT